MSTELIPISHLTKQCSLQLRNFARGGIAMSDCCRQHAEAAVIMHTGDRLWRCWQHRSWITLEDRGSYVLDTEDV